MRSAEELVKYGRTKEDNESENKRQEYLAKKLNSPEEQTEQEENNLRKARSKLYATVEIPRIKRRSRLGRGKYDPSRQEIIVEKDPDSQVYSTMGFSFFQNTRALRPEEAVFLMDSGSMEIFWNQVPLSIQQVFHLILGKNNIPLAHYSVYSDLTRKGHVVLPHKAAEIRDNKPSSSEQNGSIPSSPEAKRAKICSKDERRQHILNLIPNDKGGPITVFQRLEQGDGEMMMCDSALFSRNPFPIPPKDTRKHKKFFRAKGHNVPPEDVRSAGSWEEFKERKWEWLKKVEKRSAWPDLSNFVSTLSTTSSGFSYDVFERTCDFMRTYPGKPIYRVLIVRERNEAVCFKKLAALNAPFKDDVPVLLAHSVAGEIGYQKILPPQFAVPMDIQFNA